MSAGLHAPPKSRRKKKRLGTLDLIGALANTIGVVTGVTSIVGDHVVLFVVSLVAVLLVTGSWLWRRRTVPAVAMLAVGCLMIGGVVTFGINRLIATNTHKTVAEPEEITTTDTAVPILPDSPAPESAPATPGTASSDAANGTASDAANDAANDGTAGGANDGTTGSGSDIGVTSTGDGTATGRTADGAKILIDETFTLERNAAIDVDRPAQRPAANHTDGPTGVYDLYHDWGEVQSDAIEAVNGPNTYSYPSGNPSTMYTTCKTALATETPYLSNTSDFCLRTSSGHIAHAVITQTRQDHTFVVHVTVFG